MTKYIPNYNDPFDDTNPHVLNISRVIEIACKMVKLVDMSVTWEIVKHEDVNVFNFKPNDTLSLISEPDDSSLYGLIRKEIIISYTNVSRRSLFINLIDTSELTETESIVILNVFSLNQDDKIESCIESLISKNNETKNMIFDVVKIR